MRREFIWAKTVDDAAEEILVALKEKATRSVSSRDNVFYFDGWDGLGASTVLRTIAQRFTAAAAATTPPAAAGIGKHMAELGFDKVIHIDCSMWESRRVLQRAVAEQLELPAHVMETLDLQDEEDDFQGVPRGSRDELEQVVREMYQHIQKTNYKFLVIFHNGSGEEIDLASFCGFHLSGYSTSKVLWTLQGRFRLKTRMKVETAMKSAGTTDTFLQWASGSRVLWSSLVHQEAAEVGAAAAYKNKSTAAGPHYCRIVDQPAQVAACFLYMLELCFSGRHSADYDLATHAANYWTCDGIMQHLQQGDRDIVHAAAAAGGGDDEEDSLWRAADALWREMQLDVDYHQYLPLHFAICAERKPYWASPTYGVILVQAGAILNGDMFQHHDKLRVLKLSRCTLDFQAPPFLCCHNLRFLWLDHCQGIKGTDDGTADQGEGKDQEGIRQCFQRLWVLDVRYTDCNQILSAQMMDLMTQLRELNVVGIEDWDIGQLQGRLPNIRRLRVKDCTRVGCKSGSENDLFSDMNKIELLEFSGDDTVYNYYDYSRRALYRHSHHLQQISFISSCLETAIVGRCFRLQQISFRGCIKLKNLLLRGWMRNVRTLDISGTAVRTLDLTTAEIHRLDELYLLGCQNLCAITWPPKEKMKKGAMHKLCIDTTQPAASTAQAASATRGEPVHHGSEFPWYICVRDARLLRSLEAVYSETREIYVEVSSPTRPNTIVDAGGCKCEGIKRSNNSKRQLQVSLQQQPVPAIYGDADAPGMMWMWPCPDAPDLPQECCYMHIQDQTSRIQVLSQGEEGTSSTITVPEFVLKRGKILHIHDSMSITAIPIATEAKGLNWENLEWCRIERCPRMGTVFITPGGKYQDFNYALRTFWASQLPMARYIWEGFGYFCRFPNLTFLHLDCCPRLLHVLPLTHPYTISSLYGNSLTQLQTLEIACCGDLREVFALSTDTKYSLENNPRPVTLDFPGLKRIHLHELPNLQHICELRMSTPNLETVKIRGCWSLKRLPDVSGSNKVVECDCEKEWWNKLEWDDGSLASRYKPIHSRYYKKDLLRRTVLR